MAAVNFPQPNASNPETGDIYANGWYNEENGVTYTYADNTWSAASTADLSQFFVDIDGDTMTGDLTVPSLNGGQLAGFRNQIINGDFSVWQRGTNFTQAGQTFTADRWLLNSAQSKTTDQLELTQPCQFRYRLRTSIPATQQGSIIQPIEIPGNGSPGPFINGSVWTFSFWSNADFSAVTPSFRFADTSNDTANLVTVTGVPTFTDSGETLESNANYKRWTCTFTVNVDPLASSTCFNVQIAHSSFGTVNINYVGLQLEPGPVATPFEHRPYGTELALCQRYFYKGGSVFACAGGFSTTVSNKTIAQFFYPTTMRATPTVTGANYFNSTEAQAPSVGKDRIVFIPNPSSASNNALVSNYELNAEL